MVIASGTTISREIFSLASWAPWPLRRWVRRRKAATERVRSSSPAVALATVRRPRLRWSPPRARARRRQHRLSAAGETTVVRRDAALALVLVDGRPAAGALARARSAPARRRPRRRGLRPNVVAGVGGGLAAGQAPARLLLGLSLETGFLRAALLFLALARFGRLALGLVARLALAARFGVRFLTATVFFLSRARVDERPRARLALLFGQGAQHHAGLRRRGRRGDGRVREGRRARAALAASGVGAASRAGASPGAEDAALDLLDDHRLAAPVRKALAHGSLLDGPLQVQSRLRRRCAQSLVAAVVRFTHAFFQ